LFAIVLLALLLQAVVRTLERRLMPWTTRVDSTEVAA
jgi:hypothetical protein